MEYITCSPTRSSSRSTVYNACFTLVGALLEIPALLACDQVAGVNPRFEIVGSLGRVGWLAGVEAAFNSFLGGSLVR